MATAEDGELWEQVRRGQAAALGELYRRHARAVHRYCLWRTASKQLSEDVAATVFLEAWRRRRRLELHIGGAAPLLLGVATEVLRNYWRLQRRHARALARLAGADLSPWEEDEASARVHLISEVWEAGVGIRALPQREREVLALLVWGGLSEAEAAFALGISVETVRSRSTRSRSRLDVVVKVPDTSLLLPDEPTLAARQAALEDCCDLPVRGLLARAFS